MADTVCWGQVRGWGKPLQSTEAAMAGWSCRPAQRIQVKIALSPMHLYRRFPPVCQEILLPTLLIPQSPRLWKDLKTGNRALQRKTSWIFMFHITMFYTIWGGL